jgi:hypothetical protein
LVTLPHVFLYDDDMHTLPYDRSGCLSANMLKEVKGKV